MKGGYCTTRGENDVGVVLEYRRQWQPKSVRYRACVTHLYVSEKTETTVSSCCVEFMGTILETYQ